ncbi:hypothetical protein OQA88_4974 [Cercophora sp. LCS_1]
MRSSLRAAQAFVALGGLLGSVDAQGYFGTVQDQDAVCPANSINYLGCFRLTQANIDAFYFIPATYSATDPSKNFPDFNAGTVFDNTITPIDCVRVCRGHGYKYSALVPSGGSDSQCSGGITGNGANERFDSKIFVDTTFIDPSASANPLLTTTNLAAEYKPIGCYRISNGFSTGDPQSSQNGVTDINTCFERCAGFGYPLVYASRAQNTGITVNCVCGAEFTFAPSLPAELGPPYRIPVESAEYGNCNINCANTANTPNTCNPTTPGPAGRCCGTSNSYTVYLNPELVGCHFPLIPGYKDGEGDRTYECAAPPSGLLGGPKVFNKITPNAAQVITDPPALDRPPFIVRGRNYTLYGCFAGPALGNVLGVASPGILDAIDSSFINDAPVPQTLDDCAARCNTAGPSGAGYNLFGVNGAGTTTATATSTATTTATSFSTVTSTVSGSVFTTTIPVTETVTTAGATQTLTVTSPFVTTITTVSGDETITLTEQRVTTFTTERVITEPGVVTTVTDTLIRGGVTETVTRANVTDTLIRGGVTETVTRVVTLGGGTGVWPTEAPNARGLDCNESGCTLSLAFGALRVPQAAANVTSTCSIKTRSWYDGATTLLPVS